MTATDAGTTGAATVTNVATATVGGAAGSGLPPGTAVTSTGRRSDRPSGPVAPTLHG